MSGGTELHCSNGVEVKNPDSVSKNLSNGNGNGNCQNGDAKTFKIFIGYDPREDLAYEVCRYSLLKRSSIPIEIFPIKQSELRQKGVYWRERGKLESTEFSFSRFLTPFLANYEGWAMFVDCDFLYLGDIKELVDMTDDKYAIMCVQHDYTPKETMKMDGAVQTVYPRKNWSSMVLYNCGHEKNRALTPDVVNKETGAFLHRFQWLEDDEIGEIPFVWNFLVGHNKVVEGDQSMYPKAIHYTLGGPWFEQWKDCEFGDLWLNELEEYKKAAEKFIVPSLWANFKRVHEISTTDLHVLQKSHRVCVHSKNDGASIKLGDLLILLK
ncbi:UNVERIFIED_CONTAM: protein CDI [Sesamum latifolium]|uniref:Protein CDI n=1 Tax=Sesamum latifolium TaxID=2727402 RepID=A0AAW2YDQ0_9LAMI